MGPLAVSSCSLQNRKALADPGPFRAQSGGRWSRSLTCFGLGLACSAGLPVCPAVFRLSRWGLALYFLWRSARLAASGLVRPVCAAASVILRPAAQGHPALGRPILFCATASVWAFLFGFRLRRPWLSLWEFPIFGSGRFVSLPLVGPPPLFSFPLWVFPGPFCWNAVAIPGVIWFARPGLRCGDSAGLPASGSRSFCRLGFRRAAHAFGPFRVAGAALPSPCVALGSDKDVLSFPLGKLA